MIHDVFTGINYTGIATPDAPIDFKSGATSDSFFGKVGGHGGIYEPTAGITLSGLDLNTKYTFTIFASRNGVTDNRDTQYKVTGSGDTTVNLNAENKMANVVYVNNMQPTEAGSYNITINKDNCVSMKNAGLYLVQIKVVSYNKVFLTTQKLLVKK